VGESAQRGALFADHPILFMQRHLILILSAIACPPPLPPHLLGEQLGLDVVVELRVVLFGARLHLEHLVVHGLLPRETPLERLQGVALRKK
jgi:hypothetical protein